MNKAFVFDLDGVIIDDESIWEEAKQEMYSKLFGQEIVAKLGSTIGINMEGVYEKAAELGSTVTKEELVDAFYSYATNIYQTAPLTPGIQEFGATLVHLGFVIGIVSASPKEWITIVVDRLTFKEHIKVIISLHDRPDLPHKPAPDGYAEAIKELVASPETAIILEDSNAGIASAKAAGAYTIGLKTNLVPGYIQKNADMYAGNLNEVLEVAKNFPS